MANYKVIIPVFLFFVTAILMFISFKAGENSEAASTIEVARFDATERVESFETSEMTNARSVAPSADDSEPGGFETQEVSAAETTQQLDMSDKEAQQAGDGEFVVSDSLGLGLSDLGAVEGLEAVDETELLRGIDVIEPQRTDAASKETFASLSESADKSLLSDLVEIEDLDSEGRIESLLVSETETDGSRRDSGVASSSTTLNRAQELGLQALSVEKKVEPVARTNKTAERKLEPSQTVRKAAPLESTTRTVSAERRSTDKPSQVSIRNATNLPVAFLFNGTVRRLAPGQDFKVAAKGNENRIRFDRGGSFGARSKQLEPQRYEFRVSQEGWKLVPRESSKN